MANWDIRKTDTGNSFILSMGRAGVPGYVAVDGLNHEQAGQLQTLLCRLEKSVAADVKAQIRAALGL